MEKHTKLVRIFIGCIGDLHLGCHKILKANDAGLIKEMIFIHFGLKKKVRLGPKFIRYISLNVL